MSQLYTKLSHKILNSEKFKYSYANIFDAYVRKIAKEEYSIDREIVKNMATSIQYFYQSDNDDIKILGAEILSMLLDISAEKTPELVMIAEHVFNESGDFPNIELLGKKFVNKKFQISIFDQARNEIRKSLNTVKEVDHTLTDYQRNLWEHLISDEDIITSAPTSTGKTHIILQYIVDKVAKSSGSFAAVIVPTRALISEVSTKVYDIAKETAHETEIEICTVPKDGLYKDKTIFVMTQERMAEALQNNIVRFNYLFVDEAHNISDKNRGVLLHMVLQKILDGSNPQIIISMPSSIYLNAFSSIFNETEFITRKTNRSPVSKIFIEANTKGKNLILKKKNTDIISVINKNFQKSNLSNIVYRLGSGESNIIYRNKTNECEDTANEIAALISEIKDDQRLIEAADYVTKFIHEDFSLAENLKKGVAFHYGPLPRCCL